jgi:SAM-dependent methyltransferase
LATTRFHFVDDYRKLVRELIAAHPLDEAMSMAVGGNFEAMGALERRLLVSVGLRPEHTLVDVGCGAGRLTKALVPYLTHGRYLGTDVVPELLDYARRGCPPSWQFEVVEGLRIPFADSCADFATFFSVFTHLLHEESFAYLVEARRVVRPGGTIVFSFLEFGLHWDVFEATAIATMRGQPTGHLNVFIGRDAIEAWAAHLGLEVVAIHAGTDPFIPALPADPATGAAAAPAQGLGQSVCVLRNRKAPAVMPGLNRWGGWAAPTLAPTRT